MADMQIKKLNEESLMDAVKLKAHCWQEELNGKVDHHIDVSENYQSLLNWMHTEKEDHDKRTLLGAFVENVLVGAIFLSYAEENFGPKAIELNGLWVDDRYRGQHISLRMLHEGLAYYQDERERLIVYTHRFAPSRGYYLSLGGTIIHTETQLEGRLIVDIFSFTCEDLMNRIRVKLNT